MSRITNTILSPSIPNPQYKKYLNGRLTLTLIIPSHPSRCESWNDYHYLLLVTIQKFYPVAFLGNCEWDTMEKVYCSVLFLPTTRALPSPPNPLLSNTVHEMV